MTSAFGIDHGEFAKFAVRVPKKPGPGVKGKLRRLNANAQLTGIKAANNISNRALQLNAVVPRMHLA